MTIIKRFHKNKNGDKIASWGYDFYDIFGQRHQKSGFKTKPEAQRAQSTDMENFSKSGNNNNDKNIKLKDVFEKFMSLYAEINLKDSTIRSYKDHYNNHIKEYFKDIKLVDINTIIISHFVKSLTKKDLSPKSINNIITTLGTVFNWAIENSYILFNPVQRVKKLKVHHLEMNFLTQDEINAVLEFTKENYSDFYPLLLTAIYTGMRKGEILGLTWDCVNFIKNTIKVKQTLYKGKFTTPKTKNSIREIKVPIKVITVLKELKSKSLKSEFNLVFCQTNGKYLDGDNIIKRRFNKVLEGAGVSKIRFHDLRHTYASLLLAKDMNIKYIQKQMGHSSFEITMNTYAHLMPEVYKTSEEKINDLI